MPGLILFLYFPLCNPVHFAAMSSFRFPALIFFLPLFLASLFAQDNGLLPEGAVPPPVDLIEPVPAPEIPFGEIAVEQTLPESLKIDNQGGTIEGNLEEGLRLGVSE